MPIEPESSDLSDHETVPERLVDIAKAGVAGAGLGVALTPIGMSLGLLGSAMVPSAIVGAVEAATFAAVVRRKRSPK